MGLGIRGYELRSVLGSDVYGTSYLGYQAAIGREVSITVVKPGIANDPKFVRSFESRAGVIASLDSPVVVPIYDYWREPDGAFLIEKLVTGTDLRALIADGPISPSGVLTMVEELAEPLERAHAMGVAHGAVGLDAVVVGESHMYLTGFGIGRDDASAADDITGLAGCAAQMLAGQEGPPLTLLERIDDPMASIIDQALTPSGFATVREFVDALRHSGSGDTTAGDVPAGAANPYRGLHAFDEVDHEVFFGRERLVERLVSRLGSPGSRGRFIAVVGPSGSGKSSLVRAGLIPALRAGAVPDSENWFVATMTPGVRPFESLERALSTVAGDGLPPCWRS